MTNRTLILASMLLMLGVSGVRAADRDAGSIALSANPSVIEADGKSFCTITAQVRDRDGTLVPDGTEIQFSASLGLIESAGTVQAGTARVKLVSSNVSGTSVITATWIDGRAVARVNVEFGEVSGPSGPEYVDIRADDYLAYSVDYQTIEALGNVRLRYRSIELEAPSVQVDAAKSKIVARSTSRDNPVKLRSGNEIIEASMFSSDFSGMQAFILSVERGGVRKITISRAGCTIGEEQADRPPTEFDFQDLSLSGILVKARQATLFPMQKIQFRSANVYVDGRRVLSLPFYAMTLTGNPVEGEQYVGYSTGGLTLNLPFYYSLTPESSGALLVRHGESTGWGQYGQKPGWYVDLRQKYATQSSQGILTLERITASDWGANFTHNQQLGKGSNAFLYLDYPAHESVYGSLNLSRSFKDFGVGLDLFGGNYPTNHTRSLAGSLHVHTTAKDIGKLPFKYTLSGRVDRSYDITDAIGTEPEKREVKTTERLDVSVYSMPLRFNSAVSMRLGGGLGYVFGDSKNSGLSSLGTAVLDWRMSTSNIFQLSYRFASKPYIRTIAATDTEKEKNIHEQNANQSVSASLRLGGKTWSASLYAIQALDHPSTSLFADLSYRLSEDWRLSVRSTYQKFSSGEYDDLEFAVGKMFGSRELLAVWSKSDHKIMLELGSSGF